jgi:hypothetical protein
MTIISAAALLTGFVALASPPPQDVRPAPDPAPVQRNSPASDAALRDPIAPAGDLDTLTLVLSTADRAVVRFGGTGPGSGLIVLQSGDRIGRTAASVREIAPGRLVLDELTRDKDGRPRRAQIVFREGEPGGRRYMREPGLDAPTGVRPDVLKLDGKSKVVKKPGLRQ